MQPEPWMLVPFIVFGIYLYYRRERKKQEINFLTMHRFLADDATRTVEDISNAGPLGARTWLFSQGDEHIRYMRSDSGTVVIEGLRIKRSGEPTINVVFNDEKIATFNRSDKPEVSQHDLTIQGKAALLSLLYRVRGYAKHL